MQRAGTEGWELLGFFSREFMRHSGRWSGKEEEDFPVVEVIIRLKNETPASEVTSILTIQTLPTNLIFHTHGINFIINRHFEKRLMRWVLSL